MSVHLNDEASLTLEFPSSLHTLDVSGLGLLVSTNTAPTDLQRTVLGTALARRSVDIAVLHQKLEECKKLHLRLRQDLGTAKSDIRTIKSIIHPVRVLPPELLREIFMYRRKGGSNACVSPTDNLWRWVQVCRYWRDVCVDVPSLWSDVRLDFVTDDSLRTSGSPSSRHVLRVLNKRVSRCMSIPIDVTIIAPRLHIAGNALVNSIISRCSQWRTFAMDAPEDVWRTLDICEGSLGALKSLAISDTYHGTSTANLMYAHTTLLSFSYAPSLLSMSITDIPLRTLMIAPTTFHNLKAFHVHLYNQASAALELLPRMSSVCYLEITCDGNVKPFNRIIHLPTVTSLTLRDGPSSDGLPVVWSLLRLNNLRKLSLRYEDNILHPAWPRLSSPDYGIISFNLSFTESVGDFDYHDDASIALLRNLPNIKNLQLTLPYFCTRLFSELRDNPKFLPRLVDLTFLCWDLQAETDIAFIADMLSRRRCALECLQSYNPGLEVSIGYWSKGIIYVV
ncbi:uncharacterized protein ARMOST_07509 [Armillaria ostoyae]|uniref:F-box domain-containing protein n=1 Tax=Armillaria ostoyae TaxID=47428 RepID=A0A284R608_ARMOS|nr:uncharacterized protein ARMOST_07509 [Armillaria ostoyae]